MDVLILSGLTVNHQYLWLIMNHPLSSQMPQARGCLVGPGPGQGLLAAQCIPTGLAHGTLHTLPWHSPGTLLALPISWHSPGKCHVKALSKLLANLVLAEPDHFELKKNTI